MSEGKKQCPTCDSPAPHLHPAVQYEGEVQICPHAFHLEVTAENTPERIAEARGLVICGNCGNSWPKTDSWEIAGGGGIRFCNPCISILDVSTSR